jgi:diguanylate cyclase (GGDEF)-like protein
MIELRTLLLALGAVDLMAAAILWTSAGRRLKHGLAAWIGSLFARALAMAIVVLGIQPPAAAMSVAGALIGLSMTLQAGALSDYGGRHLPTWVHTAVMAGVAVPLALIASDPANVVLFGGLAFGSLAIALAVVAARLDSGGRRIRSRALLVSAFAVIGFAFYSRSLASVFLAQPLTALTSPSFFASTTLVIAAAAAMVSSFAFLALHHERAEGEALRMATMDPLTGAYNRRSFHEIAERELSRARRYGQPLSIIVLDIDHFRPLNERHGHRTGDEVLQRIADIIRGALRKEDMVVRYGGEEFLVMLNEVPGPGAVVVAGRIRKAVEAEPIQTSAAKLTVTVSVGVSARLDEGPESIEDLLARAEEALALAKQRGRNRVVALSLGRSIAA